MSVIYPKLLIDLSQNRQGYKKLSRLGGYVILRSLWHKSFKTHFPLDGEGGKQHEEEMPG